MSDNVDIKSLLAKTHPNYTSIEWKLYSDAYYGNGGFDSGAYLDKYTKESSDKYLRRKNRSYYLNYSAPIADTYRGYLFRKPIVRTSKSDMINRFWANTGYNGNLNMNSFMDEACLVAQIFGYAVIVIDKPNIPVATVGDIEQFRVFPYGYILSPDKMLDWETGDNNELLWVKIKEDYIPEGEKGNPFGDRDIKTRYRIWFKDRWELWSDEGVLIGSGETNLGRVPVVILRNRKKDGGNIQGRSDLSNVAKINKRLYNLCSELDELLIGTAFPILAYPTASSKDLEDITLGTDRILTFDPTGPEPLYLSPQGTSMEVYEHRIAEIIQEIYRIASLKFQGGVTPSGIAMTYEFENTQQIIKDKAKNLEDAEMDIVEVLFAWENEKMDETSVEYSSDFNFSNLLVDLQVALDAMTLNISETFNKEYKKSMTRKLLPNLTKANQKTIDGEIDSASPEETIDLAELSNQEEINRVQGRSTRPQVPKIGNNG